MWCSSPRRRQCRPRSRRNVSGGQASIGQSRPPTAIAAVPLTPYCVHSALSQWLLTTRATAENRGDDRTQTVRGSSKMVELSSRRVSPLAYNTARAASAQPPNSTPQHRARYVLLAAGAVRHTACCCLSQSTTNQPQHHMHTPANQARASTTPLCCRCSRGSDERTATLSVMEQVAAISHHTASPAYVHHILLRCAFHICAACTAHLAAVSRLATSSLTCRPCSSAMITRLP